MFRSSHHEALLEKGCTLIYEKLPPPPPEKKQPAKVSNSSEASGVNVTILLNNKLTHRHYLKNPSNYQGRLVIAFAHIFIYVYTISHSAFHSIYLKRKSTYPPFTCLSILVLTINLCSHNKIKLHLHFLLNHLFS